MAFELSRIHRDDRLYDIQATAPDGSPAVIPAPQVALLPPRARPTGATVWKAFPYSDGTLSVLLAGPDADPSGALVVEAEGDLYARVIDGDRVWTVRLERLTVT